MEVGEALGSDPGSGEGELCGDGEPIGEGEAVLSGSDAALGEGELCGGGAPVGEGEGVVFERISSRRFKICSRFQSGTR